MTSEHLSDEEIQEYVLSKLNNEHVESCALCKERAEAYQLLITAIGQEPAPVPDFDISALVMATIETQKTGNGWIYVSAAIVVSISFALIYLFRNDIDVLLNGVSTWLVYLLAVTGLFILIFMMADQFNTYKNKLQQINRQPVS